MPGTLELGQADTLEARSWEFHPGLVGDGRIQTCGPLPMASQDMHCQEAGSQTAAGLDLRPSATESVSPE